MASVHLQHKLIQLILIVTVTAFQVAEGAEALFKYHEEWTSWKAVHTKSYNSTMEELQRHLIWLSNKRYIDAHNANSHIFGFKLAMNHFGDVAENEYTSICYTGIPYEVRSKMKVHEAPQHFNASDYGDSLDWRTKGAVGSVKNQWYGLCDSCYAFSAVGALEGANALARGYFEPLSEQNIVDCSIPYGNYGCAGGNMYSSFMYVIANDGIDTQNSYPYRGKQSSCSYSEYYRGATQSGIIQVKSGDEDALLSAVYHIGPISVAVDARSKAFKFYDSGVFDSARCTSTYLTHAMLITGFGTYQGKNYWLVKNSWGTQWGLSGYILMTRNGYNQCGIATEASYPTL